MKMRVYSMKNRSPRSLAVKQTNILSFVMAMFLATGLAALLVAAGF